MVQQAALRSHLSNPPVDGDEGGTANARWRRGPVAAHVGGEQHLLLKAVEQGQVELRVGMCLLRYDDYSEALGDGAELRLGADGQTEHAPGLSSGCVRPTAVHGLFDTR